MICFSKDMTLIEENEDECMKTNTYMLLRVIYEWCIGLCHEDDLKMKTIGISCILCVHVLLLHVMASTLSLLKLLLYF